MTRSVDALLRAARPADPTGREAERIVVRVLARVAALEGAGAATRRRGARRRAKASGRALLAATIVAAGVLVSHDARRDDGHRVASVPAPASALDRALAGERRAAAELWALGPRGRALCLERAEGRGAAAEDAVALFGRLGGPADAVEAARLASLHDDPVLAPAVLRTLAASTGDSGPRALAELLRRHAGGDAGVDAGVVAALVAVARNGRPFVALEGLRDGGEAGSAAAAAAALRIGGASEVERTLRLPRAALAPPDVGAALAVASAATQEAVLRRLDRGDAAATRLAVAARLPSVPARLAPRLADPLGARLAARAIASLGGPEAWRVLPLGLDGPASVPVRRALRAAPAEAAATFVAEATRRGAPKAAPYLAALAEMGDAGAGPLEGLARVPATAAGAVAALGRSRSSEASGALLRLAARSALVPSVAEALAVRVRRGDAEAGPALLELARHGFARVALEALAACGPAARVAFAHALADPRLRRAALAAAERSGTVGLVDAGAAASARGGRPWRS